MKLREATDTITWAHAGRVTLAGQLTMEHERLVDKQSSRQKPDFKFGVVIDPAVMAVTTTH